MGYELSAGAIAFFLWMRLKPALKLLTFFLCALVFVGGCGERAFQTKGYGQKARIVFKHGRVPNAQYLTDLIAKFNVENPSAEVIEETLPASTDQQHQYYVTSLEGKSADFDVFALDVIWTPEFIKAGWLEELSAHFGEREVASFLTAPIKANSFEGKLYAVPWFVDAGLLYYRSDLLQKYGFEPPQTVLELVDSAKAILDREKDKGLRGFVWQGKQYEGLVCNALEYIASNGGSIIGEDGRAAVAQPRAVEAISFMRDLIYRYGVSPKLVITANEEITRHIFGQGRAIYMRNWAYAWTLFQQDGSPVKGKVGVKIMPHFQGGRSAATLGGWQLGVNKYSQNKEAAVEFIRYLTSYEVQKGVASNMGLKPSRRATYEDPEVIEAEPFMADLLGIVLRAVPRPVTPFYLMISQVLQPELSAAIAGVKSPQAAMENAAALIDHILEIER